jgi:hypothetical protein
VSNLSRRRFLEDVISSATATTIAASAYPAWSAEERQSTKPNERLNVAVLGVGKRGINHAIAYASCNDSEITILCDADPSAPI